MTATIGTLATGGNTGLSKLLTYRIMIQPERDAALIRDYSDGMSLDDDNLIEIVTTRTNEELSLAIKVYLDEYKKDLVEIVKAKASYKNYREFMLKLLECNHDEDMKPLDIDTARTYAQELYAAGAGRTVGIDPEPFIRILPTINNVQFQSINEVYKDKSLMKDMHNKLGGALELVVVARCSDKFEYLAGRVDKAMKGSFSIDKDVLCRYVSIYFINHFFNKFSNISFVIIFDRIFGCLSRPDCIRLKDAYDRGDYKRTLEQALKSSLTKGNLQKAFLDLITSDPKSNPVGTDREFDEEVKAAVGEGERAKKLAESNYKQSTTIQRGDSLIAAKHRGKLATNTTNPKKSEKEKEKEVNSEKEGIDTTNITTTTISTTTAMTTTLGKNESVNPTNIELIIDEYDDEIPTYIWDAIRARFMDTQRLGKELKDCQQATKEVSLLKERITDEIIALKDIYSSIIKSNAESEAFIRIYTNHIRSLKELNDNKRSKSMKKS